VRRQHLLDRAEPAATEFARYSIGAAQVRINHSDETNRFPLLFEFFVNAGVIASENAYAHDRDRNRILRRQKKFPVAGCREEIVNGNTGNSLTAAG
jgi:hypothetical protein